MSTSFRGQYWKRYWVAERSPLVAGFFVPAFYERTYMSFPRPKKTIILLSIASGLLFLSLPILVVISFLAGSSYIEAKAKTSSISESSIIELVNEVRAKNNAPLLKEDAGLDSTAKIKGEDMAARNYWAHTDPDGVPFQILLVKDRPGLKGYGENLAECFTTNQSTIDGWVGSPGHFENMINPRFNIIGSYTLWDADRKCTITVNHFGAE